MREGRALVDTCPTLTSHLKKRAAAPSERGRGSWERGPLPPPPGVWSDRPPRSVGVGGKAWPGTQRWSGGLAGCPAQQGATEGRQGNRAHWAGRPPRGPELQEALLCAGRRCSRSAAIALSVQRLLGLWIEFPLPSVRDGGEESGVAWRCPRTGKAYARRTPEPGPGLSAPKPNRQPRDVADEL